MIGGGAVGRGLRWTGSILLVVLLGLSLSGCFDYEATYRIHADGRIWMEGVMTFDPMFYHMFVAYAEEEMSDGLGLRFCDETHSARFSGFSDERAFVMERGDTITYAVPLFGDSEIDQDDPDMDAYTAMLLAGYRYRVRMQMPARVVHASHGNVDGRDVVLDMDLGRALEVRAITIQVAKSGTGVSPVLVVTFVLVGIGLVSALGAVGFVYMRQRRRW